MGLTTGCIQVYTGQGKGKTTAALGLAMRAVGRGLKVVMIQFLKGDTETGERIASRHLTGFEMKPMGRDRFIGPDGPEAEDEACAEAAFQEARRIIASEACDVVILDEINVAVSLGLVPESKVLEMMRSKPSHLELILTGRNAPKSFLEEADLVTTMVPTKHYFDQGQAARLGIEH